jgi:uncharacterized membrane protein YhaH (DUF805 family)
MKITTAISTCLRKYATFSGTASRAEFWWFYLFCTLIAWLTYFIHDAISLIFSVATLIPTIATASRRLHDTGRSGWWQTIAFIPFLGIVVLIVFLAQKSSTSHRPYSNESARRFTEVN